MHKLRLPGERWQITVGQPFCAHQICSKEGFCFSANTVEDFFWVDDSEDFFWEDVNESTQEGTLCVLVQSKFVLVHRL